MQQLYRFHPLTFTLFFIFKAIFNQVVNLSRLTSMEADPVSGLVHLNDAFSATCNLLLELFPLLLLSRADVSTVCCLRMLVNRVSRSPMEACLNHGNEIFRRPDPPDFGALGGRAPDSGLVTDILSITSHSPWTWHPSKKWNKKSPKISLHHLFVHSWL